MKLSLKNILIWAAGLFAIIAFVLMFANQIKVVMGSVVSYGTSSDVLFDNRGGCAWLSVIGYFLVLLAGLGAVAVSFLVKNEKVAKIVFLACAGAMVLGALMVFFVKANYIAAAKSYMVRETGCKRSDLRGWGDDYRTCGAPVISGILAMMGAAMIAVPMFVKLPDPFAKK